MQIKINIQGFTTFFRLSHVFKKEDEAEDEIQHEAEIQAQAETSAEAEDEAETGIQAEDEAKSDTEDEADIQAEAEAVHEAEAEIPQFLDTLTISALVSPAPSGNDCKKIYCSPVQCWVRKGFKKICTKR